MESTAAPTDQGLALDVRGDAGAGRPQNTIYNFVLNNFPGQTAVAQTNPSIFALDFSPDAGTLFAIPSTSAASNPNTLGTINTTTAAFTPIAAVTGDGGLGATGLAIDPMSGAAYISQFDGSANSLLASIDLTTGVATPIGTIAAGIIIDISMNCEGQLFGHNITDDSLYSIDVGTGVGTVIGGTGLAANFAQGMDFDNDDGTLYGYVYTGGGTNTFGTFNLATGAVTPLASDNPLGEYEGAIPTVCPPMDADIAVAKTVAAPAAPVVGDAVTYTLTASNAGPGDAMNVVVTDTLPANLTYVSNTCGAAVAGQVVTWTIGTLANGGNATCDIATTINNFGPVDNTATITSDTADPNGANNSATASLGGVPFPADVGVTLTASTAGGLAVGDTFVYTVTGTNFGPGDATGVLFALTLSNKVSFVSSDCGATVAGNVVSFSVPTLANGATTSCGITVAVVLGGDLQATASVTTATVDPNLVNNVDGITIGFDVVPVPALDRLGLLLTGLLLLGLGLVATRRF
ncbi:MAG: DUF11 domain-containing protein [Lysobacterales bacterium]